MATITSLLCTGMVALPMPLKESAAVNKLVLERAHFARVATSSPLAQRSMALAVLAPAASAYFGVHLGQELDPATLSLAIAAASGFGISTAYARRERCFHSLSQLRDASASIQEAVRACVPAREAAAVDEAMHRVWASFTHDIQICDDLEYNQPERERAESRLYRDLNALSALLTDIRASAEQENPSSASPVAGRARQTPLSFGQKERLAAVLAGEERRLTAGVRRVRDLASIPSAPFLLRGCTVVAATVFPVLTGPHFAAMAAGGGVPGLVMAASVMLALSNAAPVAIQEALADPLCHPSSLGIKLSHFDPPGYDDFLSACVGTLRQNTKAPEKGSGARKGPQAPSRPSEKKTPRFRK